MSAAEQEDAVGGAAASDDIAARRRSGGGPIRVMVVDDSAVIRGLISRWLDESGDVSVVATCANGAQAVRRLSAAAAEVVVLDIEMPEMDGLTALPKLLEIDPRLRVVMASTLTKRNADVSLKALSLGAADYVAKPTAVRQVTTSVDFRRELVDKVVAIGRAARIDRGEEPPRAKHDADVERRRRVDPVAAHQHAGEPAKSGERPSYRRDGAVDLRSPMRTKPQILAIGSSTGGPQALADFMTRLDDRWDAPIVVTQHMPPMFTAILAEHLARVSRFPAAEARDGEVLAARRIYVAPGDFHMRLRRDGDVVRLALDQAPPENFCRPAVDPLFRTVAEIYGAKALAVVLTGMGADGRAGARAIVEAGGGVIAQDAATSVVWGMPGAVAEAGLCFQVAPVVELAETVARLSGRGTP